MRQEIERMVEDFETGRLTRRQLVRHLMTAAAVLAAGSRRSQEVNEQEMKPGSPVCRPKIHEN